MHYRTFAASRSLPPGIRCIWMLEDDAAPDAPAQRVVPDGCVELILNIGDRFRQLTESGTAVLQPAAMVVGDARRPVVIAPTGGVDIIGIRFEPGGAPQFLGAAARDTRDGCFDLDDVNAALRRDLLEEVADAPDAGARLQAVQRRLAERISRRLAPDRRLLAAAQLVTESQGRIPLDAVTRSVGVSSRWLQRRFRDHVGFGPKLLGRLTRFHSLVATLDASASVQWARIAAAHGYYDQPHLIRDFRTFAGTSPATYLREPSALNALFARPGTASGHG